MGGGGGGGGVGGGGGGGGVHANCCIVVMLGVVNGAVDVVLPVGTDDGSLTCSAFAVDSVGQSSSTATAAVEWIADECMLLFGSQMADVFTDDLIGEFDLEQMRDYLARVRRDRKAALAGTYRRKGPLS